MLAVSHFCFHYNRDGCETGETCSTTTTAGPRSSSSSSSVRWFSRRSSPTTSSTNIAVCRRRNRLSSKLIFSFRCSLAGLVAFLTLRLIRFQEIYTLITFGCLFAFWFPSTVDSSFRRYLKSAESIKHLLIPSNITSKWCPSIFLMKQSFSFLVEPSSLESASPLLGFIDEFFLQHFIIGSYVVVAGLTVFPHQLQKHLAYIETINHRRLFATFRRSIIPLILSSIAGQLVSGFVDRPLDMLANFRPNSLLIVQIIGFLLALFSSFIFGVVFASVQQSKSPLPSSWSKNDELPSLTELLMKVKRSCGIFDRFFSRLVCGVVSLTCSLFAFYQVRPLFSADCTLDSFRPNLLSSISERCLLLPLLLRTSWCIGIENFSSCGMQADDAVAALVTSSERIGRSEGFKKDRATTVNKNEREKTVTLVRRMATSRARGENRFRW